MACHRPVDCLVSGRTTVGRDPVASGGDGVSSCPARRSTLHVRPYHRPVRRRGDAPSGLAAVLVLTLGTALAGCSISGPTTSTAPAGTPSTASPAATSAPSLPSQTATDWGRIWDAVPASFPVAPGAVPATDTGQGPVSALLAVEEADQSVADVARFYGDALEDRGMLVSSEGPLEDGSVTLSASDGYDCRVQVGFRPAGSLTLIAVLYGAGCAFN